METQTQEAESADPAIKAAFMQGQITRQDRRAVIDSETVKGLFLVNGGGAIAILALLQAMWGSPEAPRLIPWILAGLALLMIGLLLALAVNPIRHTCALKWEGWFTYGDKNQMKEGDSLSKKFRRLSYASIACFGLALGTVIVGSWKHLPAPAQVEKSCATATPTAVSLMAPPNDLRPAPLQFLR